MDTFAELMDPELYVPLPDSWIVATADIIGSTRAIAAGDYKAVNTVGVSVISSILNAIGWRDVPYIFGGDGAMLLLPPDCADSAWSALSATIDMARAEFRLDLRAAVVPMSWIRGFDRDLRVVRHRVSEHYVQCAVSGSGATFVDARLKDGSLPEEFVVEGGSSMRADYSGLECRWQNVPSPKEETISLIVDATGPGERHLDSYRRVLDEIERVYGDPGEYHPISESGLRAALAPDQLRYETNVRTHGMTSWRRLVYRFNQLIGVVGGWVRMKFGMSGGGVAWGDYKTDLVANSDFRKFDGWLRLVLSGDAEQRGRIEGFLRDLQMRGDIRFGLHVSKSAIVTCLIKQRQHEHFHFVDGGDGGYAAAAASMKSAT